MEEKYGSNKSNHAVNGLGNAPGTGHGVYSADELCQILHISTQELTLFETGPCQMSQQRIQVFFAYTFAQMRERMIRDKYMQYARRLR